MLEFIVLGQIPGTSIQIEFTGMLLLGLLLCALLCLSTYRRIHRTIISSEHTTKALPAHTDLAL